MFTLDHIGLVVPDLARAGAAFTRLGFRLTPESSHHGQLTPCGPLVPFGTGNHCAMFRHGYLELLGVTAPDRPTHAVADRLQRYAGLQLIALGSGDAAATHAAWDAAITGVRPLAELGRDVPLAEGGTTPGRFRLVYLEAEAFPEAELFAIEHLTPTALWQPALLDHPNGARAVAGVTVVSDRPAVTADRLAALGCGPAAVEAGALTVPLADGAWLVILDPATAAARFPGETPPAVPSLLAATVMVGDLAATAAMLTGAGVAVQKAPGALQVASRDAEGCVLRFVAAG